MCIDCFTTTRTFLLLLYIEKWTNDVYPLQRQSSDVSLCKESRESHVVVYVVKKIHKN